MLASTGLPESESYVGEGGDPAPVQGLVNSGLEKRD